MWHRNCANSQCAKRFMVALVVFLVGTAGSVAQLPTATILGMVKDSSGAVVPATSLTARNVETGQSRTAVSAADGSYRFAALPVGTYQVRAEHSGFQREVQGGLTLSVGQEAVVNFSLQVGAVEQTVSVTGEAPLVNTTSGSLGGLVSEERVADLPLNGRNFTDLTLLQTGIVEDKSKTTDPNLAGTFFSSNGAPVRSNNYLLDGAIMQGWSGATPASSSGSSLGVEGIREWRVITNNFSAEYGLTMGSQTTIVTKSGTNSFHGSAFEFLRNDKLDARNFFDYTAPNRLPPFKRNNFGGSLGGPIRKDKLFFFLTYEGLRERLGVTTITPDLPAGCRGDANATVTNTSCPALGSTPSVTISPTVRRFVALFPMPNLPGDQITFPFSQPTTEDYGQGRFDYTISPGDSFFGRFTDLDGNRTITQPFPGFPVFTVSRNQYSTLSESHVFSPTLLNTFRFSYSRTQMFFNSPTDIAGPGLSFVPGQTIGSLAIGGVGTFGPFDVTPADERQNIFTWSDDLFFTKGSHSLKFGMLINRYQIFLLNSAFVRGRISFPGILSFLQGQPSVYFALNPGSIIDRTWHYTTLGFYTQDDWRVKPRLTLNLGLRYEFNTIPDEATGRSVALRNIRSDSMTTPGPLFGENPSLHNFSPRFGFAWDVQGDGKTAVRGGVAWLYDISTIFHHLLVSAVGTPPYSTRYTVGGPPAAALFSIPLTFPPGLAPAPRLLDYRMQQPNLFPYNVTVERLLPFDMALTLAYAGSRAIHLLQTTEGNPVVPTILPDGRKFFPVNAPRINPNFSSIELRTAAGNSWYNSLQFGLLKRISKGLQFQSSYTWSKTLDETQSALVAENTTNSDFLSDPSNIKLDKAPALFDTTQVWRFNAIYRFPNLNPAGGVLAKVLNGWWMSSIVSLQSGLPFSPVLTNNRSRSGVDGGADEPDRPDLVPDRNGGNIVSGATAGCPGVAPGQKLGTPNLYYDPCAFTLQPAGFLGTAGRNILRGPGFAALDLSITKDTSIKYLGESGKVEFRAEFFNLLNRPNFATPGIGGSLLGPNNGAVVFAGAQDGETPLSTAGRITQTASTSRQIQFALKLLF